MSVFNRDLDSVNCGCTAAVPWVVQYPMSIQVDEVIKHIFLVLFQPKLLTLGQCLPQSCEAEEVGEILKLDPAVMVLQQSPYRTSLNIFDVRRVPGSFDLRKERKFTILL